MNNFINTLINNATYVKEYKKDEIIFLENSFCNEIGIVIKGKVKISSYTYKGNEIIFNILNENKIFGQSLIFSSSPYYKGNITCEKDCKIAYLSKKDFLNSLLNNNLYETFLTILSNNVLNEKEKNRVLSFNNIEDKILYLLYIHDEISFNSVTELSKRLSTSRECMSKTLSKLIKANKIERIGKSIKLTKKGWIQPFCFIQ